MVQVMSCCKVQVPAKAARRSSDHSSGAIKLSDHSSLIQ